MLQAYPRCAFIAAPQARDTRKPSTSLSNSTSTPHSLLLRWHGGSRRLHTLLLPQWATTINGCCCCCRRPPAAATTISTRRSTKWTRRPPNSCPARTNGHQFRHWRQRRRRRLQPLLLLFCALAADGTTIPLKQCRQPQLAATTSAATAAAARARHPHDTPAAAAASRPQLLLQLLD